MKVSEYREQMTERVAVIEAQVIDIYHDIKEIKQLLKEQNGRVRKNEQNIARITGIGIFAAISYYAVQFPPIMVCGAIYYAVKYQLDKYQITMQYTKPHFQYDRAFWYDEFPNGALSFTISKCAVYVKLKLFPGVSRVWRVGHLWA